MPVDIDQQLFLILNSANSPFWDKVMHFMSMIIVWIPLYLGILVYLGTIYKKKLLLIILIITIAVTITDQSALIIKNSVERFRPCHEPMLQGLVHTFNNECGGTFGFVSSHAANSFNIAFLSLLFIRKKWFTVSIIIWASVISYSRIYLGVHYPGDVLCGAIIGAFIGLSMYRIFIVIDKILQQRKQPPAPM
jgi:undecaprenyl-diphosphatase